jgi:hypothetical protein
VRFFSNPSRDIPKKLERAAEARGKGELGRAAQLYEEIARDAAAWRGPDDGITLTAREDAALVRLEAGEIDRACDLLLGLVGEMELAPSLGPDHRHTIRARVNLATAVGARGEHAAAYDLLTSEAPRAVRVLGPDDPDTFVVEENLANAGRRLAEPVLDRLLTLDPGTDAPISDPQRWAPRVARALELTRGYSSCRSKSKVAMSRGDQDRGGMEWQVDEAPENRLRVFQTMHVPPSEDLFDRWVVVDDRRYQDVGFWVDVSNKPEDERATDRQLDAALRLSACTALLTSQSASGREVDVGNEQYFYLEYQDAPALLRGWQGEVIPERTHVWLRSEDDTVVLVDCSAHLQANDERIELRQAFCDFGAPIPISAPPSPLRPSP